MPRADDSRQNQLKGVLKCEATFLLIGPCPGKSVISQEYRFSQDIGFRDEGLEFGV